MVMQKLTIQSTVPSSRLTTGRFIVGLPLLVSVLFAFSFVLSEQRPGATNQASNPSTNASAAEDLTLVVQPSLPQLTTIPASSGPDIPVDPTAVGPSSTTAGAALQSAGRSKGNGDNDSNAQLQATRKSFKLDELSL